MQQRLTSDIQITRRCPSCGSEVTLSLGDLRGWTDIDPRDLSDLRPECDPPQMSRVVHALCGCYIFEMPDSALGRLLASVLAVEEGPPDEGGPGRPGPDEGA